MLDGMHLVGTGNHADHPDPIPAYVGNVQPSSSQNLKVDELQNGASPASNAAAPSTQNAGTTGATNAGSANVETAAPHPSVDPANSDPATTAQPSGTKSVASNPLAASIPAVDADAATAHFAQLGNDATAQSNAAIQVNYPEVSKHGSDLAKPVVDGLSSTGRSDNVIGEPVSPSHALSPQIFSSSRATPQPLNDRTVIPEPGGGQSPPVQLTETQPQVTMPSIANPVAGGVGSSGDRANEIAPVDLQTSETPWVVGDKLMRNQGVQHEAASGRAVQPAPTAAISAKSLTPQSGFVDMIFSGVGQDTAKGLKSLSQEPLDPWILRGVVIQPANPTVQGEGPSRLGTSPQSGSRDAKGNPR